MSSSYHSPMPHSSGSSPYNPISLDNSSLDINSHNHNNNHEEPASLLRTQSAASAEAHRYIRQANRMMAQHHQREARRTNSFELPATTPPRPLPLSQSSRSRSATPNSKLARYSFPNHHDVAATQSSLSSPSTSNDWNHPSSTRSAPLDHDSSSFLSKFQKLRRDHSKLRESHQALSSENKQLKSQTEEWKTKTSQLEARLLESMQARSGREQKFQEEMKRQRASMNSLFTELADSKRETELLKKQLKDTLTKLQLQQALTANIAFQQEQEELEYQMEQEQFRRQQQLQEQDGLPSPTTETVYDANHEEPVRTAAAATIGGNNNPRDAGYSRLGNFFNRRRQGNGPTSASLATATTNSDLLSMNASKSMEPSGIGQFTSYEESKNDLFEQMQGSYGSSKVLLDTDTTTTVTTEDSSSNPASSRFMPEDYLKAASTSSSSPSTPQKPKSSLPFRQHQKAKTPEEMNYGQTSASMPPAAPMSRLDRIRQKRRNLEAMFRQNGASEAVVPTTNKLAPRKGRALSSNRNGNRNHQLVNLMNHRRHDD